MRRVSIVIPSRNRPRELMRCLTAVAQQDHSNFEVVVVACPKGQVIAQAQPNAQHIKLIPYDGPNLSHARNLGISQAAGDIIAFLDDDAVPETRWLTHLSAAFTPTIQAVSGAVVERQSPNTDLRMTTDDAVDMPDAAHRLSGQNMAVLRSALTQINGFDPAFQVSFGVADLSVRLTQAGYRNTSAPLAVVHHDAAENAYRHDDHRPKSLFELGASYQIWLRKHLPKERQQTAWHDFWQEQRKRMFRLARRRKLNAASVSDLIQSLQDGGKEGQSRTLHTADIIGGAAQFQRFPSTAPAEHTVLGGWIWKARSLRRKAQALRQAGHCVTLVLLSPTWAPIHVRYCDAGHWEHQGGLFSSKANDAIKVQSWHLSDRILYEGERVQTVRGAYTQSR
jgi:glycosyltransferase involved in cell wall biosynthesis